MPSNTTKILMFFYRICDFFVFAAPELLSITERSLLVGCVAVAVAFAVVFRESAHCAALTTDRQQQQRHPGYSKEEQQQYNGYNGGSGSSSSDSDGSGSFLVVAFWSCGEAESLLLGGAKGQCGRDRRRGRDTGRGCLSEAWSLVHSCSMKLNESYVPHTNTCTYTESYAHAHARGHTTFVARAQNKQQEKRRRV